MLHLLLGLEIPFASASTRFHLQFDLLNVDAHNLMQRGCAFWMMKFEKLVKRKEVSPVIETVKIIV